MHHYCVEVDFWPMFVHASVTIAFGPGWAYMCEGYGIRQDIDDARLDRELSR